MAGLGGGHPLHIRFEGSEVSIRKEGDRVILEPVEPDCSIFWARLDELAEEAGDELRPPPDLPADPPPGFDD